MHPTRSTANLLFAATLALCAASAAAAPEYIGVIKRSSGQVAIERDGVRIPSPPGTEVKPGDRLITGPDGYAQVKLNSTALSVSPEANIALDRFVPGEPLAPPAQPSLFHRLASFLAVNRHR